MKQRRKTPHRIMSEPAKEFVSICRRKWGRMWRYRVAEHLKVHPTTVWRWTQSIAGPPEAALLAMRAVAKDNPTRPPQPFDGFADEQ